MNIDDKDELNGTSTNEDDKALEDAMSEMMAALNNLPEDVVRQLLENIDNMDKDNQ